MAAQCPLFTQRHIHHSTVWMLQGVSTPQFCLACATERLEDKSEVSLTLHCRRALSELQALLGAKNNSLIHTLSSDKRVLEHLSTVVFGLLVAQDATTAQLAIEVLDALANHFSNTELPRKLLQKSIQTVMATQSFLDCLPHLTFLGRLLHSLPPLCGEITHSFGGFLEYLCSGLTYPEETVKSAVVYILVQLSMKTPQNTLPTSVVQTVCQFVAFNLASAKSHNLTLNLLGLVKGLLRSSAYSQCLLQTDRHTSETKGSTLASAFKRVLLSNDETLQLSGVQCVTEILVHRPQYGQTLLQADIAEFMFEALDNRRELLMTSLFSCLNSLATVDDFYSKGHIIYGIDQVISGLMASLEMKNYNAAHHGFTFLSNVLQRQPATMPLFTTATADSLQKLLSVVHSALQTSTPLLVPSAITTLSHLLSTQHLPSGFSLPTLLPLLSLLLHLLETHLLPPAEHSTTTPSPISLSSLLTVVFIAMENMHKICAEVKNSERFVISDDVTQFLSISFEESLLPAILRNTETLDDCKAFSVLFNIARIQLESSTTPSLAVKLASLGFIHFSFDVKSKFSSAPGAGSLCSTVNECVEWLCVQLEMEDCQRRKYIRDTLHTTLPDINCGLEESLKLLYQRSSHVQAGGCSSTLSQLQRAVLALFYHTQHEAERVTPGHVVLQALERFLVHNPDIHLLPAPSLAHLTALYAQSVHDVKTKSDASDATTEGSQILVRALVRVSSPASVFSATPHLLPWAFTQPVLHHITRAWFWEWLHSMCESDRDGQAEGTQTQEQAEKWSEAIQLIQKMPNVLDTLLVHDSSEVSTATLALMDHLLSEECLCDSDSQKIFSYLEKVVLVHRIQPLSEDVTASVMKLLAKSVHKSPSALPDLKLIYHTVNFVTRCCSEGIITGLNFICEILSDSRDVNSQVIVLMLNNNSFLARLVSCLPTSSLPTDHSAVSTSALRLIASLIHHQHRTQLSCASQSGGAIHIQSALATLLHHSTTVLASGLYFWRIVATTGGHTGCFTLCDDTGSEVTLDQDTTTMRKLLFLVQNSLVKDDETVREAGALCLTELVQYFTATNRKIDHRWDRVIIDHISTTSVHSHIPDHYLPCLATLIRQSSSAHSHWLRDIAQLLYGSVTTGRNLVYATPANYTACFNELEKIDQGLLDTNQWTHLREVIPL